MLLYGCSKENPDAVTIGHTIRVLQYQAENWNSSEDDCARSYLAPAFRGAVPLLRKDGAAALPVLLTATFDKGLNVPHNVTGWTFCFCWAPWSYPPCTVKFGNTSYYIVFFLIGKTVDGAPAINTPPNPFFQVTTGETLIINSNESFGAIQGAKYSFGGLRIVVGSVKVNSNPNVNSNQLILYVKSTISNSEPIISPAATPAISPTPYPSSPVPVPTPPYIVKWN